MIVDSLITTFNVIMIMKLLCYECFHIINIQILSEFNF